MSWLSSGIKAIGKGITGAGHAVGKVLSNPLVQGASAFIPGVGPLITAGEGALGGLLKPGGNLGQAAGGALTGAASGFAGGGIKRLATGGLGGLGSQIGGFGGGTLNSILHGRGPMMDANGIDGQGGGYPSAVDGFGFGDSGGGFGGFLSGAVKGLGGSLLGGGGGGGLNLGNLATLGLGGYQAYNAAKDSARAGKLSDKALSLADQRYADAAPLRAAGQATLLNPPRPDLSGLFAGSGNPFANMPAVKPLTTPTSMLQLLSAGR